MEELLKLLSTDFLDLLTDKNVDKNIENNIEICDLTNDDEYNKLVETITSLKDNSLFKILGATLGISLDDYLDELEDLRDEQLKEKRKKENETRKVIDKSVLPKTTTEVKEIDRPSKHIDVNMGLKIHKLVQEYVDTMIKPYNPKVGGLNQDVINDAYAGLYEYSCWLYNHK